MTSDVANFIIGAEPIVSLGNDINAIIMFEGKPIRLTDTSYFYFMKKVFGEEYKDPDVRFVFFFLDLFPPRDEYLWFLIGFSLIFK